MRPTPLFAVSLLHFVFLLLLAFGQSAFAGQTWDGGGTGGNWTTGANWNPDGSATSGSTSDIFFAGSVGLSSTNDYAGFVAWRNILFNSGAGAFTITSIAGANWDLYGKIENNSTSLQTINIDAISLKTTSNEFDPTSGNLTISAKDIYTNGNNLNVWGANTLTINNTGGAGIQQTGLLVTGTNFSGSVILNGSNSYGGGTSIQAGTVTGNNSNSFGTGTIFIGNGGSAFGNVSGTMGIGASGLTITNTITTNKADNGGSAGTGTRTISATYASGTSTLQTGTTSINGGLAVNVTNAAATLVMNGVIKDGTDTGVVLRSLTKSGAGTLSLGATNTYTGSTILDGGTLRYSVDNTGVKGLVFGGTNGSTNLSTLDMSTTPSNVTATGLTVQTLSSGTNAITLGASKTLTVNGNVTVNTTGINAAQGSNLTFNPGGAVPTSAFTVTGANTFLVGQDSATTSDTRTGVLDMRNLGVFNAGTGATALSNFVIGNYTQASGANYNDGGIYKVYLAPSSTIYTSALSVGKKTTGAAGQFDNTLYLGSGTTGIHATTITVGETGNVSTGSTITWDTGVTGGALTLNGTGAVTAVTNMYVGYKTDTASASAGTRLGTVDLSNGTVTGTITNLYVGYKPGTGDSGTSPATTTGVFKLGAGAAGALSNLTIGNLTLGYSDSATSSRNNPVNGTFQLDGGSVSVTNNIVLTNQSLYDQRNGTLTVNSGTLTVGGNITSGTTRATSVLNLSGGTLDMTGGTIGTLSNPIGTFTINPATAAELKNVGSINGTAGITKTGVGALTLNANNYTGVTAINAGSVLIDGSDDLGNNSATNTISLNTGTLRSTANSYDLGVNRDIALAGAGTIQSDAGTLTVSGDVTNGANLLTLQGAGNILVSGTIGLGATPTGGLNIGSATSAANVTLSGNNLFTGNVSLPATNAQPIAVLTLTNSGALGVGPKTVTSTGGQPTNGGQIHLQNNITLASNISFTTSGYALYNDSGNNTVNGNFTLTSGNGDTYITSTSGSLTLNGNVTANTTTRNLHIGGDGDGVISGVISNGSTAALQIFKDSGSGTWTLTGNNTNTGVTTISSGTLRVGAASGAATAGTLATSGSIINNASLIFRRTNTSEVDLANAISGNGDVQYEGTGVSLESQYAVNNPSTYSGGTIISNSRVNLTSSTGFGTNTVVINSGGQVFVSAAINVANDFSIAGSGWAETAGQLGALRLANGAQVSGDITMAANSRIAGAGTSTISGVIGGGYNLEIGEDSAAGTVILSGSNNYSGGTKLSFGTLKFGNVNALGSGTLAFNGSSTLQSGTSGTVTNDVVINPSVTGTFDTASLSSTFSGIVSGPGALTKIGSGTLTLSNSNSYTGATTVSAGLLAVSGSGSLGASGSSALTMSGGALDLGGGTRTVQSLSITAPASSGTTIGNGSLSATSYAASNTSGRAIVSANLLANGSAGLAKSGAGGTLVLAGSNTFIGFVGITSGTVSVSVINNAGVAGNLGATPQGAGSSSPIRFTTNDGSKALEYTGGGETTNRNVYLDTQIGGVAGTIFANGSGALTLSGTITQNASNGSQGTAIVVLSGTNTGDNTLSGAWTDNSRSMLRKTGVGTWSLVGNRNYSGPTDVQDGTLKFNSIANAGAASSLGQATQQIVGGVGGDVDYWISLGAASTTGTLEFTGTTANSSNRAFGLNGNGVLSTGSASGTLNLSGSFFSVTAGSKTFTLAGASSGTNVISGGIVDGAGTVAVTKAGSGQWVLSGSNSYSGGTTLTSGTLVLGNKSALGTSTLNVNGAASLQANTNLSGLNKIGNAVTLGANLTIGGSQNLEFGGDATSAGSNSRTLTITNSGTTTISGNLYLAENDSTTGRVLEFNGAGATVISGNIHNNNFGNSVAAGLKINNASAVVTLSGTNDYTGATTLSAGTINVNSDSAFGAAGSSVAINGVTLNNTTGSTRTLSNSAFTLGGNNTYTGTGGTTLDLGTGAMSLNGSTRTWTVNGGTFKIGGVISGSAGNGLTKSGSGTLVLSGSNSYSGSTTLNAGTLNYGNVAALGSGTATFGGDSTLQSGTSGTVANNVRINPTVTGTFDTQANAVTLSGIVSGSGALTKTGVGTLTLTGSNNYGGGTMLTSGTLVAGHDSALGTGLMTLDGGTLMSNTNTRMLANDITVTTSGGQVSGDSITFTGNAGGTGTLNVNLSGSAKTMTVNPSTTNGFDPGEIKMTQGTLVLGGSNKIGNDAAIDLAGGTFKTEGYSETVGALTLSANSTIDFNNGTNTMRFASLTGDTSNTLALTNWSSGNSHLVFTSSVSGDTNFLGGVSFNGSVGAQQIDFSGGGYELVPVPEPATIIGAFAFVGLIVLRERRRFSALSRGAFKLGPRLFHPQNAGDERTTNDETAS